MHCPRSGGNAGNSDGRLHGLSHAYASRRRRGADGREQRATCRHVPPGRRRLSGGCPRGCLDRHHDGVHTAGRSGDGDTVWFARSRTRALAGARGRRPRSSWTRWSTDRAARARRHRRHARGAVRRPEPRTRAATTSRRGARLARVYIHRLRAGIAPMAAALGGLDGIAFTGGVGENAPEVRARRPRAWDSSGWPSTGGATSTAAATVDRRPGSRRQELRRPVARGPRDRPVGAARPGSGAPAGPPLECTPAA